MIRPNVKRFVQKIVRPGRTVKVTRVNSIKARAERSFRPERQMRPMRRIG